GHTNLPAGYWVYLKPFWFIWRDQKGDPKQDRAWGPEQATGSPNTQQAGDIQTAWASRTADGQPEWLLLEYPEPINAVRVKVYETYNPGAVTRITTFAPDGGEIEIWKGKDTTGGADGMGVLSVPISPPTLAERAGFGMSVRRIKLYLDSQAVPG